MADNNKVTIDAAYFNLLFTRAVESERLRIDREGLILECEKIAKERDELKAKLAEHAELQQRTEAERVELKAKLDCADVDRETYKDRAEAAERCIEDCWGHIACGTAETIPASLGLIEDIIRAYREKKEAAR